MKDYIPQDILVVTILKLLLCATFLIAMSANVFACSCMEPNSLAQEFSESKAVFIGKAISKEEQVNHGRIVTLTSFEILRNFKAAEGEKIVVGSGPSGGGSCGYKFSLEEEYLIYAYGEEDLHTNICTRTKHKDKASDDLLDLEAISMTVTRQ